MQMRDMESATAFIFVMYLGGYLVLGKFIPPVESATFYAKMALSLALIERLLCRLRHFY
jgi:hypothetical protein